MESAQQCDASVHAVKCRIDYLPYFLNLVFYLFAQEPSSLYPCTGFDC